MLYNPKSNMRLYLPRNVQTSAGVHTASYWVNTGVLS